MIFIIISILCSVTVAILLKLARRYKINIPQAVTFNYLFAVVLGVVFFKPNLPQLTTFPSPIYIILGVLLPVVFWILAGSIRRIGIVKTDIAQRLSLFIPIIAAYFIFQEHFSGLKVLGLITGLFAIVFILYKTKQEQYKNSGLIFPILVFLGFGIIDVLFKKVAQVKTLPFTTSLVVIFGMSFIVSLLGIVYLTLIKKEKFQFINVICGCILGLFNFGNIFFYLKAHQVMAEHPSTVFATMNIGVITLGTLVGLFIFKEKLKVLNFVGLALAVISVLLITLY